MANTPSTKFRLGSLTKQFTAASILLLEERGKLKVEDPVKKYLPDAPAAWDKMTISHVLTHTAGYAPGPNGVVNAGFIHMSVPFAAGALYSTTEDLLRWEQGLFGGKLLSPASLQKMTTPFKNDYAFGLEVHTNNGHKIIEHNGGIEGFSTELAYYPEDKLTVIALGNLNSPAPGQIAVALAGLAHGGTVTLQSERKEITLDPKVMARYVGAYQMPGGPAVMLITLDNNQLISQLTNQGPVPIFPMSENRFFPKVVDAELEFSGSDAQGRATQMALHQNGRDMAATRIDDSEYKRLADAAAAKRVKDQTGYPEGPDTVRRLIEELRSGQPKYDLMSANLAAVTRQQLPQLQGMLTKLGAIQTITFKGVGPGGADIYEIKFENGSIEYRIMLSPDGKTQSAGLRVLQ